MAPDAEPLNLDPLIPRGSYPRTVLVAAEDRFANFRGSQITLTLDNRNNRFSEGQYKLAGGEEIAIINGPQILWSGTVDPEYIEHNPDSSDLRIRVLQHGSLLNTVEAGLPDWTLDQNGEVVFDYSKYYRYRGTADQWVKRYNEDGTFGHNEILEQDAEVFYTPSARDALEDELYRAKFAERVYHFHTFGPNIGDIEWPLPHVSDSGYENAPGEKFTGQFQPHYRPNFDLPPEEWDNQGGVVRDNGAYLRTQNPTLPFRQQSVQAIIAELVRQFNRTAKFPLQFDPDTDCTIIPPAISAAIEILKRQPNVEFIDLRVLQPTNGIPHVLALVNWKRDSNDPSIWYSVYEISNETELTLLLDRTPCPIKFNVWPNYRTGLRFARVNHSNSGTLAHVYALRGGAFLVPGTRNTYGVRFDAHWSSFNVSLTSVTYRSTFTNFVAEELGEYIDFPFPPAYILNRSASFGLGNTFSVRRTTSPFEPNPPEHEPDNQVTLTPSFGGGVTLSSSAPRTYRAAQGGLTVSGALFDRVAVDAENTKLSALLSDLAKLTHSRWWVTPDRRLKFISRQHAPRRISLKPSRTLSLQTFARTLEEQDIPEIGSAIVLPQNFRHAHKNWLRDNAVGINSPGFRTEVPLEDLDSFPAIGDAVRLADPAVPQIPAAELKTKYNNSFLLDSAAIDIDNETVAIEASLPTI